MSFPAAATKRDLIVGRDLTSGGTIITDPFLLETEQPIFWHDSHEAILPVVKRYATGSDGIATLSLPNTSQAGWKDALQQDITNWHYKLTRGGVTVIFALPAGVGPVYLNDLVREAPSAAVTVAYQGVLTVDGVGPDVDGNVDTGGGGGGGGSSTLAGITDMSPNARTFNAAADYPAMRTALGVPTTSGFSDTVLDDTSAGAWLTTLGFSAFVKTLAAVADGSAFLTALGASVFGKTLLGNADASAAQTTLGISTFVKTLLSAVSASAFLTALGVTTFAKSLLDDPDAATALGTLGATSTGIAVLTAANPAAGLAALGGAGAVSVAWADITGKPTFAAIATSGSASDLVAGTVPVARVTPGTKMVNVKSGGTWSARHSNRSDLVEEWVGPDPSPAIVSSGTGGMYVNDQRGKAGT